MKIVYKACFLSYRKKRQFAYAQIALKIRDVKQIRERLGIWRYGQEVM